MVLIRQLHAQPRLATVSTTTCEGGRRCQHHKAAEFHDRCMDSFERLDAEGERNARVMAIAVHPYISGTPFRIKYFGKVLDEVSNSGCAVMWTGGQILDWYRAAVGESSRASTQA